MKMLQNNEIDNFKRDGAIFLKNKFDISWISKLQKGIEIVNNFQPAHWK